MIVDHCLMRHAAIVSPHPPLDGVTRKEDGYNYEMAYASEVSSTCEVKSPSGDFGGMETGETDPARWDRWPSSGPGGPEGLGSWGNREFLWGKLQSDCLGKVFLAPFPSREWGDAWDGAFAGRWNA